jgi:hypothetical protein
MQPFRIHYTDCQNHPYEFMIEKNSCSYVQESADFLCNSYMCNKSMYGKEQISKIRYRISALRLFWNVKFAYGQSAAVLDIFSEQRNVHHFSHC